MKIDKESARRYYEQAVSTGYLDYYSQELTGNYEEDKKLWFQLYSKLARKKRYEEYLNNKKK